MKKKKKLKLYKVVMTFDMSWGSMSRRRSLTYRTTQPQRFLTRVRNFGYLSRGRMIAAHRLIEARIVEVKA